MAETIKSRVETISPQMAEKILARNTKNRPLRKRTVAFYAEQMTAGNWQLNGEPIIISTTGELLDGQHRLAAVVKSGVTTPLLVVWNVDPDSFKTIDTGLKRSTADAFCVAGIQSSRRVSAAIFNYLTLSRGRRALHSELKISTQVSMAEFQSDPDFWVEIARFSEQTYRVLRIMTEKEIGGYAAYLIKGKGHPESVVKDFFRILLVDDIPTSKTLACLRRRLTADRCSKTRMTQELRHNLLAKTWNFYLTGVETSRLSVNPKEGAILFK